VNDNAIKNPGLPTPLRLLMWGGAAGLLLIPLIAMRFTAEVDWTAFDFIAMGVMLALACGAVEAAARMSGRFAYRLGAVVGIGGGFLMTWSNLAVGLIGNEDNPLNLLFFGVLAIGPVGAYVARFRAEGMARTMLAMTIAQIAVGVIAFLTNPRLENLPMAFGVTIFFGSIWLLSGALFRSVGQSDPNP
jgi:hypothetical protein